MKIIKNIKSWSQDTIWFLNFDIKKTLNSINKNKLLNFFLNHFKSFNLNILICVILKNNLKKKKKFFKKLKISQVSILSVWDPPVAPICIKGCMINNFSIRKIKVEKHNLLLSYF